MKITTVTVYGFEMAKFLHVQLRGVEATANVRADTVEDKSDGVLVLKSSDKLR